MAAATDSPAPPQFVDSDTHVYEPVELWTEFLDPKLRDQAPSLFRSDDDRLMVNFGGKVYPTMPGHRGFDIVYGPDAKVDKAGNDPHRRLELMDEEGAAVHVVYPTFGLNGASQVDDPVLAGALCRAYNRYMGEFVSVDPSRLRGAMLAPLNHPEVAAEEMRWARENTDLSILCANPTPIEETPWSDPRFRPVWQAAQDLDITVTFHELTAGAPMTAVGMNRYTHHWPMIYVTTHVIEPMLAMTEMILYGTLERFPSLRIGMTEAHASWLPGWLRMLDDQYGSGTFMWREESGEVALSMQPSDYFRRQCYLSAFVDDGMLHEAIEYAQNIVVCSDWPHPIAAMRGSRRLRHIGEREDLTEQDRRTLLIDTPRRFFGLA